MAYPTTRGQITNHEEVRDCVLDEFNGVAFPIEVAEALHISKSTARRYLEDIVRRGWAVRGRSVSPNGGMGIDYTVFDDSRTAYW